jgi:hypothetical protein
VTEVIDVGVRPPVPPVYLGDGVYASFDGYQIWLHVGAHTASPVAALEPAVLDALNAYAKQVLT